MKKVLGIFFVAVAMFAIAPTAKAQYTPPATLKGQFNAAMKKVGKYISDIDAVNKDNDENQKLQVTRHKDIKDRWDKVEGKAGESSKASIKKLFDYSNAIQFTIENTISESVSALKKTKDDKDNMEKTEPKVTNNKNYMLLVGYANDFVKEAAADYRKTSTTTEFIRSKRNALTDALEIVKILEESKCEVEVNVEYPADLITLFNGWSYATQFTVESILPNLETSQTILQSDLYDALMYEWYFTMFEYPEGLSKEDQDEVAACADDIYQILQTFNGYVSYLECQAMMWESMMMMAGSYEDPYDALAAYAYLATWSDDEAFDDAPALINFAIERYEQAMAILAKAGS